MKYAAVISMLAVLVAAETINDLVDQIPTCAVNCIRDAAQTVNSPQTKPVTPQICAQVGESNQVTAAGTAATTPTTGTATGAAVTSTTSPAAAGRMQVAGWAGAIAAAAAFAL
ncbi:CFEM domain-containing protein [Colletotrichum tofieldiae]|nr:CFEM domain-containing protein [Colletotrichum tofieldiae]